MQDIFEIPAHLVEKGESFLPKYEPVLDFEGWRVAMLRYFDPTEPTNFQKVERHNQTNEVFILTDGEADLIICENGPIPGEAYVVPMKKNVAYNIGQSVWHHVVMSKDAHIILFEKSSVSRDNSDYYFYDNLEREEMKRRFRKL
jgi:ureidoglycolate hydrolase